MDPAVEPELLSAARRGDQQGGNPLFRINPQRIGSSRVFRNGGPRNMLFVFVWSNCECPMVNFKEKRCLRPLDKVWFSLLRTIKLVLRRLFPMDAHSSQHRFPYVDQLSTSPPYRLVEWK